MQPSKASAISAAELQAYSLGKVDPQRAAEIEALLATDRDLTEVLDAAPDDAIVRHLRGAGKLDTLELQGAETLQCDDYRRPSVADHVATSPPASSSAVTCLRDVSDALVNHPRYQMVRKLGEGGMGAVFLAEHRLMHRPVALKLIRPACLNNPQAVERFRREVQTAARLNHPNIVTAHDAEEAGGTHFLVMEYVEGVALSEWAAQRGPLPAAEACRYVLQAVQGLQYAHEKGMVHRDLKPHNLMRTPDGTIKILDFGLARFSCEGEGAAGQLTAEGMIMGTPDYMAPEQARDTRHADIRADIYSLGCTLYQLLAGRVPFPTGSVVDKIFKHAQEEAEPLGNLRPDLPAGLEQVVARMMAKEPANRYQTPLETVAALAPFAATPPPRLPPMPSAPRRRLLGAVLLGVLAVVAAAAVVVTVKTDRGVITIRVEDSDIEVVTRKNGDVVLIRDTKAGQSWDLDTRKLNLGRADEDNGLRIELDGAKPLVLRRRDGRLVTITGPTEQPVKKPEEKNVPEELGKARLTAAGLPAGSILIDDDFKNPKKSEFEPSKGKGRTTRWEFADGRFVLTLRGGNGTWAGVGPDREYKSFICQATARISGETDGVWGIDLDGEPEASLFKVMVRGDGQVELIPDVESEKFATTTLRKFPTPEGFRPGGYNTLVVARQDRTVSIFLNGTPVTKPFTIAAPSGKCTCLIRVEQAGKPDVRVELQRYTVWDVK